MFRLSFLNLFIFSITCAYTQVEEKVINEVNNIAFRDSAGNIISSQKAKQLLQTGKYISVPALNNNLNIESIIRRPNSEDKDTYKTYTGDNTVISTMGYKEWRGKYTMGDTLPPIEVKNYFGAKSVLTSRGHSVLIFWEDVDKIKPSLDDQAKMLRDLILNYTTINFVLCPKTKSLKLSTYLPQQLLKEASNIYLATDYFLEALSVIDFPTYMVVDPNNRLKAFIMPPPSNQLVPFFFLREYLSKAIK